MASISGTVTKFKNNAVIPRAILILAIAFFLVNSWWSWQYPLKFDSPDETMGFLFSQRLRDGEGLTMEQPLREFSTLVHPRGVGVSERGQLAPATFLGMIIVYGVIGKILPSGGILFLTPIFSALALLAFFSFIIRIFPRNVAVLSTMLLAIHPAFWYYSSRGMFHNALFLDLLIIGLWALFSVIPLSDGGNRDKQTSWKGAGLYVLAGLSFGAALIVRSAEFAWVMIALTALLALFVRKIDFRIGFWVALLGFSLPFVLLLILNTSIYGHPFSFGYEETISSSAVGDGGASALSVLIDRARFLAFPFGIHWQNAFGNLWNYGVALTWWLSVPTVLGITRTLRMEMSRQHKGYLVLYLFASTWLVLTYGSWIFFDNPDASLVSLGTSYSRYWLPLYAFGLPYAALVVSELGSRVRTILERRNGEGRSSGDLVYGATLSVAFLFMLYFSFSHVVVNADTGLATIRRHAIEYRRFADRVASETPENAVIVAGKADKIFFPEREVIVSIDGPDSVQQLRALLGVVPAYLSVSPVEATATVQRMWSELGFSLGEEIVLGNGYRLFTLQQLSNA